MKNKNVILLLIIIFVCRIVYCSENDLSELGICAHRGANSEFPENTVPAFERAVAQNVAMVELDVRLTKDKQLVVLHDWTVNRTSNGKGNVFEMTFDELRALDFGAWKDPKFVGTQIPTFDEVLAVLPRNIWINVHCGVPKGKEVETALAAAERIVADGREHQAFLACETEAAIDAVGKKYPRILICNMDRSGGTDASIDRTIERECAFIQLAGKYPTPVQIDRLKAANVKINYFGTNDADEIKTLLGLGVDFPLCDNVPLAMGAFGEWEKSSKTKNEK